MKRTLGLILLVLGIIATAYTAYNAISQSEHVKLLGADITVSESGSFVPVFISAAVAIVGLILLATDRK